MKNKLVALFFLLHLISCTTEEIEAPVENQEEEIDTPIVKGKLTALQSSLWKTREIEVCWENPSSDNLTVRNWVKDQIEKTWMKEADIVFFNWGKCKWGNKGIRIQLVTGKETPHVKRLGEKLDGYRHGMVLNYNWTYCGSSEYCNRVIATHEFGHALGFSHEHNRADCRCKEEPKGTNGDLYVTPCDINSVMNYCNKKYANHGLLSDWDKKGVIALYGPSPTVFHSTWLNTGFAYNDTWRVNRHLRFVEDVNGDGKGDIIGFADNDIYVSLSNGSGFDKGKIWLSEGFTYNDTWRNDRHFRTVKDVNGDGKGDIVGFADNDIYVALSNGSGFDRAKIWLSQGFAYNDGWRNEHHVRVLEDVNGDGKADIIGFGANDIYVSLSNGHSFEKGKVWLSVGYANNDSWTNAKHVRTVKDVNGDGKADIIGFGENDIYVSLSNGSSFEKGKIWLDEGFTYSDTWRTNRHVRAVEDVNGDGKADIIGFGEKSIYISLSNGQGFEKGKEHRGGFTISRDHWFLSKHVRAFSDVDGDNKVDFIGFHDNSVVVHESKKLYK